MQFKPVPEPPIDEPRDGLEAIDAVRRAVPVRSGSNSETIDEMESGADRNADSRIDCCSRIVTRTAITDRAVAADWLPFLRALRLVIVTEDGYVRPDSPDSDLDPAAIRQSFRDRVYRAGAVLDVLEAAETPLDARTVADRVAHARPVPTRDDDRPSGDGTADDRLGENNTVANQTGIERIERLLGWTVALDLADRAIDQDRVRFEAVEKRGDR